ncbi:MAG: hypothetical protein LBQ64_05740 [Bacteroidales bacterium]|jgi:hypothetical protein|nr:hypothetical protein [Bacteroidales bacterium]
MELKSKKVKIIADENRVFDLLTNCNNIAKYMPADKIKQWEATQDSCSFAIEGLGQIKINIQEQIPCTSVTYDIGNTMLKAVSIRFFISPTAENNCELEAETKLDMPFTLKLLVTPSLQKFMDMMVDYVRIEAETIH